MGNEKEEARRRLQLRRARTSATRDARIVSDFELACMGCVPIFGGLWAFICIMVATGVVA